MDSDTHKIPCISEHSADVPDAHFTAPDFLTDDYELTFGDHFDQLPGSLPDNSKWRSSLPWGPDLVINSEEQRYTDVLNGDTSTTNPFNFDGNSNLIITAGLNTPEQEAATGQKYYSGVLTSFQKKRFRYGYSEARIKLPEDNQGLWSAFWLLNRFYPPAIGATGANGKGPPEIDWEFVRGPGGAFGGGPYTTLFAPIAYHYDDGQWTIDANGFTGPGGAPGASQQCDGTGIFNVAGLDPATLPNGADLAADFHRYGLNWTADYIRWYLDDVEVGSICDPLIVSQVDMYLILNQAVGGNFPGPADPDTYAGGAQMLIDYICLFQTPEQQQQQFNSAELQAEPIGWEIVEGKRLPTPIFD